MKCCNAGKKTVGKMLNEKSQRWYGAEEGSGGGAVEVGDKIEERTCNFIGERDPVVVSLWRYCPLWVCVVVCV